MDHGATLVLHERPLKPLLRGWSHVVGFVAVAAIGGVTLGVADASTGERWWLAIYVAGMLSMFGVSALYHRVPWRGRALRVMGRLDHSTIFLAIAGCYTPIATTFLSSWHQPAVLGTVWGGTAIGILLQWLPVHVPRALFTSVYVVVGWAAAIALPQLYEAMGPLGFSLLLGGGLSYTVGAVVYALRRPDPWPTVFGFHEVFHLGTIIGAGCHVAAIGFVVLPRL